MSTTAFRTNDSHAPSLFSLEHLSCTYGDGTRALADINLSIAAGDRIALVGPNGSGKSTLIRHLNGLLLATEGTCHFQGEVITQENAPRLRKKIGILFQDPDDQLFCANLYEDVAFGPRNQGKGEAEVDRLVRRSVEAVGLSPVLFKPAHHLSFGQKKRAALAAVLAMEPEVLIVDEPAANLDPRQEAQVRRLLAEFTGTLLVIEHDLLFLWDLCTRAVVLTKGRLMHDTTMEELAASPASLREHGLDCTFRFTGEGPREPVHHHHHHHYAATHVHADYEDAHVAETEPDAIHGPLIELQHFSYCYPDGSAGITDINFSLFAGETVALVGENGAGKSTLARCLLGLLTPQPGGGTFLLDGHPLTMADTRRLWQRVALVPQNAGELLFCPTCREEVAFGPQQLGLAADVVAQRVREALALVRLQSMEERVPLHLSGGERRRLALAAVLSLHPEVLILDEPTASLDPQGEELLVDILPQLPITKVLITHDLFFIHRLSRRTVVLHQGAVIRDYATSAFMQDEQLLAVNGLDYTYKNSQLEALRQLQHEREEGRHERGE